MLKVFAALLGVLSIHQQQLLIFQLQVSVKNRKVELLQNYKIKDRKGNKVIICQCKRYLRGYSETPLMYSGLSQKNRQQVPQQKVLKKCCPPHLWIFVPNLLALVTQLFEPVHKIVFQLSHAWKK